ncbi:MAG: rhomboid family intramembrane serine protease [Leptolinea sp.]|nr:rhomboid family intramembrane serine protease [Leptolinea sp.]
MLPIKDTIQSRIFPVITFLLIAVNSVVFFFELSLPSNYQEQLLHTFGLVPVNVSIIDPVSWIPLISHQFLHGGWWHFLSNIWILFIFGDNVEDRLGSGRFLFFYLLGGVAAGVLQVVMTPGSPIPSIGASGAIAAVLGAYFLFYPHSRVITLIPVFIFPWFIEIPSIIYLGFWFVMQLFSGLQSLATVGGAVNGGIAWWAHIGGFLFGLFMGFVFSIGRPAYSFYRDEQFPW